MVHEEPRRDGRRGAEPVFRANLNGEASTTSALSTHQNLVEVLQCLLQAEMPLADKASRSSARLIPASSAARLWEMRPWEYQTTAAAKRISWTTSFGDLRKVAKTSESNSTWTRVIVGLP
jgi:hypothetical protein